MKLRAYYHALKFRFNRFPSHVVLFVTAGCNARCRHCFYWQEINASRQSDELTLAEIVTISAKLGHVKFLSITGGEPTLRDDLPEIISTFSRHNQTQNVTLHTNGFYSEKLRDMVVRAATENPRVDINVAVSIDGLAETHDMIRGVPGIFDRAVASLGLLSRAKEHHPNITVTVNTCFNFHNQDEIERLSVFLYETCNIDGYYISYVRGDTFCKDSVKTDPGRYLQEVGRLVRKNIIERYGAHYPLASLRRTLDFLAPQIVAETVMQGEMVYPCKAGKTVIVISEKGDVKPCEMLAASFGNVRDHGYDVGAMLFSPAGEKIKKTISLGGCCCTWECAIMNNIIFNWRSYPRLLKTWFALEFRKMFGGI